MGVGEVPQTLAKVRGGKQPFFLLTTAISGNFQFLFTLIKSGYQLVIAGRLIYARVYHIVGAGTDFLQLVAAAALVATCSRQRRI